MEALHSNIIESRQELMIPRSGDGAPTSRTAHFLTPSINSGGGSISKLPAIFEVAKRKLKLRVSYSGWSWPTKRWKTWVTKMAPLHATTWKKAGIYEAILNSMYTIVRDDNLIIELAERWCPETNSFIFPWGEATVTLEDVMITGYSVLGVPVFHSIENKELRRIELELKEAKKEVVKSTHRKASQSLWMQKFMDSGSEIEHEAFLAYWLSRFVLPFSSQIVSCHVFPIAICLARGTRVALAPAVLASIYRDLSLLKQNLFSLCTLETNESEKETRSNVIVHKITSPFQLVQVWSWERFLELRPKRKLIQNGKPRSARWDNSRSRVKNARLALDSAKDRFVWRPYAKRVPNWTFPMFYADKETWLSEDSELDGELLSFIQCLKVSELVGLDCIEQYLPHRVAMQFGFDQDVPGEVAPYNTSPEISWGYYNRPMIHDKFYIPSRLSAGEVTIQYLEWWQQSASNQQRTKSSRIHGATLDHWMVPMKENNDFSTANRGDTRNVDDGSINNEFTIKGSTNSLKRKIGDVVSRSPSKSARTLGLGAYVKKINSSPVPPGFPPKCTTAASDFVEEGKMNVAQMLQCGDIKRDNENRQCSDDQSFSGEFPSSSSIAFKQTTKQKAGGSKSTTVANNMAMNSWDPSVILVKEAAQSTRNGDGDDKCSQPGQSRSGTSKTGRKRI
ncbi:hypothetical protein K2173_014387 [Erythroxylum novogranatense]|uniref:Aminotransferase-like plant mobile domain-containing protein n=1 Tax=Erythroxylum novogranatense TaxID=1862640 RepID=A0AAV8S5Z2_9ROSI|nr:hypothetical protein K2173_014387 [Erythroxylum novogranatense]